MYKWVYVFIVMAIISILPTLGDEKFFVNSIIPSILYVICFALFFRGQSLLQSVNLSKIKHPVYLRALMENNRYMKGSSAWLFVCITIFFVIDQCLGDLSIPFFDFRVFTVMTLLEAIAYYDCNYRHTQKLKNQISEL